MTIEEIVIFFIKDVIMYLPKKKERKKKTVISYGDCTITLGN